MTLVVSDASPLIALQQIGELKLLQGLFGEVLIPPAVAREGAARRLAQGLGLRVAGTLGLLNRAKEKGLLEAVRPHVDTLVRGGFYATPALVERILMDAGEA